jgi:hypothetical protein
MGLRRVLVQVGRGRPCTYETDLSVEVGDTVAVPRRFWDVSYADDEYPEGKVVGLDSDYTGECKALVRIVRKHDG